MLPTWATAAKGQGGPKRSHAALIVVVVALVVLWRQFSIIGARLASLEHQSSQHSNAIAYNSNATAMHFERLEQENANSTATFTARFEDLLAQVRR